MAENKTQTAPVVEEDGEDNVVLFYDTAEEAHKAGSPNPKFKLFQVRNPDGDMVGWTWARYNVFAHYNASRNAGYKVQSERGGTRSPEKTAASVAERMDTDPIFRKLVEAKAAEIAAAKAGAAKDGGKAAAPKPVAAPAAPAKPAGKPKQLARS